MSMSCLFHKSKRSMKAQRGELAGKQLECRPSGVLPSTPPHWRHLPDTAGCGAGLSVKGFPAVWHEESSSGGSIAESISQQRDAGKGGRRAR